jgi:uncharacterized protein
MSPTSRLPVVAGAIAATALVVSGCSGGGDADEQESVAAAPSASPTTPAAEASPASSTPAVEPSARVITVTGTGEASGTPDTAELTLGVEVRAATTSEALAAARESTDSLLAVLRAVPVPEEDLQTTSLSVYPNYEYTPEGTGAPTGYVANVTIRVRTTVEASSAIVDDAAAAVGDALRVQGLSWTVADPEALLAEARRVAVVDAEATAASLAEAAGAELGPIVSISTGGAPTYPYLAGEGDVSAIPFAPGQATITAAVTVAFELLP